MTADSRQPNSPATARLIEQLGSQLEAVQPLPAAEWRAARWLGIVALLTALVLLALAYSGHLHLLALRQRLADPRSALEALGIAGTAVCATLAAFVRCIPGRSTLWNWLPVPPLLLWIVCSGVGCFYNAGNAAAAEAFDAHHCFRFIVLLSLPLGALLAWQLRRASPIDPEPVLWLGGLGVAATAAVVLEFFHPFDVTFMDLGAHLAAVGAIMLAARWLARRLIENG